MTSDSTTRCPTDDTLAAFVEGALDAHTRAAVLAHVETCSECMAAVLSANVHLEEERVATPVRSTSSRWWMAIAAAVLIAIVAVPLLLRRRNEPMARLVALAPRAARLVEPRLSGGFAWAAYAGAARATSGRVDAEQMKLVGAAGELIERADREGDSESQHAAGVAMVMTLKPADAIPRLEDAAAQSKDAKVWSDLAAARYAAASQLGRASLYPLALAAADAALRADPKLAEALFNRALILERLGLTDEARRAWERYLEVDSSSRWASEARARLADLPRSTQSSQFERDRPLLEQAAVRGDARAVRGYVDAHRDRARAFAEAEYLGRWGEAMQRNDGVEALRWLSIARAIGTALVALSGESLARDAVHAIDAASASERDAIAEAHVAYRRGRIAYSRSALDDAQRDLVHAAAMFENARDPMALAARYYAASVRLARNETAAARAELERARSDVDARLTFISLGAHVRWELGRVHMIDEDWTGAAPVLAEGAAMFRRAGEGATEAFVESMLARALAMAGRADEAWLARMRAFAALSAAGETDLLITAVDAAMHAELQSRGSDAALALSALELAVARGGSNRQLILDALLNQSRLQSMTGNAADGLQAARQAEALARATEDPALRARQLADVDAAFGAALAQSDSRGASAALTRAIAFYTQHDLAFALPEALLLRARCAVRAGGAGTAMRDLEAGMAIVERRRGSEDRTIGVLDAEHALYADAIRLSLDEGSIATAFAFAERSRGAAVTLAELQERLAGSGVAVLEIVAMSDELVAFAVSENDIVVGRSARSERTLSGLAEACISEEGTVAASALYDEVIRPVDAVVARARSLVIVPDARLGTIPFAALYDTKSKRYLIERIAVSVASSAASLQRDGAAERDPSLAAIELPSTGVTDASALPEAGREVGEITALYRRAESIAPRVATLAALRSAAARADVLHVAGHTESQPGGGEQALLLANGAGAGFERVSWKTILGPPSVRGDVVVLAACETLRPPASAATRGMSLGQAFAAAGARDVIGTLAPIGDRDARLLFRALHRRIADGARPAEALRAVQQEAIAEDSQRGGPRSWRAIALLTHTIAVPNGGRDLVWTRSR